MRVGGTSGRLEKRESIQREIERDTEGREAEISQEPDVVGEEGKGRSTKKLPLLDKVTFFSSGSDEARRAKKPKNVQACIFCLHSRISVCVGASVCVYSG